jgi:hypothetical protein
MLRRVQFNVVSMATVALVMFLLGIGVAIYGPALFAQVAGRQ